MDVLLSRSDPGARSLRAVGTVRAFPTTPGRVYELRAVLRRTAEDPRPAPGLSLSVLRLGFVDAAGHGVDPRIAGLGFQVPHLDPLRLETLPADGLRDPAAFDAALASRFFAAPPDAAEARLTLETPAVELAHLEVVPLAINWPLEGARFQAEVATLIAARLTLLARLAAPAETASDRAARAEAEAAPRAQLAALGAQFAATGDWAAALARCDAAAETRARTKRLTRLRTEATPRRVGFIGSARGWHRLGAYAEAVVLREADWPGQLAALALDAIVIETAPQSVAGDWQLAFCSLEGTLPAAGRALCDAARDRGIPIRLHVGAQAREIGVWRDLIAAADAVTIEDDPAHWPDPPRGARFVRRAVEPAVAPPLRQGTAEGTMLVPVASDLFQFPAFAALLDAGACYDLLVTEFDYGFDPLALKRRLPAARHRALPIASQAQRTRLLQESTIVLMNAETLRAPGQARDIALDAIACGAIPVLAGAGDAAQGIAPLLDRVWSAPELQELQRLYRIPWLRERRWRQLWRALCRGHVWCGAERAAVLGADPCARDLDAPVVSAILVSKRPHRLKACLEAFRKQSWAHKELILVLNTDAPSALPALRDNERVFAVPQSWNIGRCLNMARAQARGRYWAKIDDDDHYSRHYLEELAGFFRATQADAVGRQAVYFHFAADRMTCARTRRSRQTFRSWTGEGPRLAGATLSARTTPAVPPFSNLLRNCVDSEWVKLLRRTGLQLASFDSTSMIVHRDADPGAHTWKLPPGWEGPDAADHLTLLCEGNAHELFEQESPDRAPA